MNDARLHRRFRFSLRKLLLWMTVAAVYLGTMQWAKDLPGTVFFGLCLATAVIIRLTLRLRQGILLTSGLSIVGLAGFVVQPSMILPIPWGDSICPGLLMMIVLLLPASMMIRAVNGIDSLLEGKTLTKTAKHGSLPSRPDAPSTEE